MTALMGPIEAGYRQRIVDARRRMGAAPMPVVILARPPPQRYVSPFAPERNPPPPPVEPAVDLLCLPSWKTIAQLAALKHGLTLKDILGPERSRRYVAARHEAISLVYTHTRLSLPGIGRRFNRDHSSALHAVRKSGVPLRESGFDWTPKLEAKLRRLWAKGWIIRQIAEELGTTFATVSGRVTKLDLPTRTGLPRTKTNWQTVDARRRGSGDVRERKQ